MQKIDDYQLVTKCKGYVSKPDPTNTDEEHLVAGSQNMVINDEERVQTRAGYALFGAAATGSDRIKSEFAWEHTQDGQLLLREVNGTLYWYSLVSSAFEVLFTELSTTKPVRFTPVWNTTELIDILNFINGDDNLYEWCGGEGTYVSSTATTIVISEVIADERFLTSGTRLIRVKDSGGTWREFTVDSQAGSTFTVSGDDPTNYTFTAGTIVVQSVITNATTPASGFNNDVLEVFQNQLFVGSLTSQRVYVSDNTDYTDFTFSSPRIAGEGALITVDAPTVGLASPGLKETDDESKVILFAKRDKAYEITFEISPGDSADREVPRVKPLPLAGGQGAQSHELIEKVKNTLVWVSNDNELLELGQVQTASFADDTAISDPIKPDFLAVSFANGAVKFWRNSIFVTAPSDLRMFVFDVEKKFWNTPLVLPVGQMSVYNNLLYGHSGSADESYQMFTGVDDNGFPIAFKAHFAYRNMNKRAHYKNFNRFFTELYIQANTVVTCSILYEWKGAKGIQNYELDGSDSEFLFTPINDASLGVNPLGTNPLGGLLQAGEDTPKYRRFKPITLQDHFEYQVRFECDLDDAVFQVLASGANTKISNNIPTNITK